RAICAIRSGCRRNWSSPMAASWSASSRPATPAPRRAPIRASASHARPNGARSRPKLSRAAGSAFSAPTAANSRSWTFVRSSWKAPRPRPQAAPMADLILQERLQPALLDRLTDDEPEKLMESREQRVISLAKLRQCILRDLSWLLNAVRLDATQDLSDFPLAE